MATKKKQTGQPKEEKRGKGRPSKFNEDIRRTIIAALQRSAYVETAAATAGISKDTFYRWTKDGARLSEKRDKGLKLTPDEAELADFSDAVKKTLGNAEVQLLDIIRRAATVTWPAAAWILERRYPERYSRRDRHTHENPDGSALAEPLVEALNKVFGENDESGENSATEGEA